jgi:hypothetical protein
MIGDLCIQSYPPRSTKPSRLTKLNLKSLNCKLKTVFKSSSKHLKSIQSPVRILDLYFYASKNKVSCKRFLFEKAGCCLYWQRNYWVLQQQYPYTQKTFCGLALKFLRCEPIEFRFTPIQHRPSHCCSYIGSVATSNRIGTKVVSCLKLESCRSLRGIEINQKGLIVQRCVCRLEIFSFWKSKSQRPRNLKRSLRTSHYENKRRWIENYISKLATSKGIVSLKGVPKLI